MISMVLSLVAMAQASTEYMSAEPSVRGRELELVTAIRLLQLGPQLSSEVTIS